MLHLGVPAHGRRSQRARYRQERSDSNSNEPIACRNGTLNWLLFLLLPRAIKTLSIWSLLACEEELGRACPWCSDANLPFV
jgi:hypothetical protein